MAVTVITTSGDPTANSYCSVAEADAIFGVRLYADDWQNAASDDKARALITATQLLDENYDWFGATSTVTQALCWPRFNMPRPNQSGALVEPYAGMVDPSTIPDLLKRATALFAQELLKADRVSDNKIETQGISQVAAAGAATLTFNGRGGRKVLPDVVGDMLRIWGTPRSQRGQARLSRG